MYKEITEVWNEVHIRLEEELGREPTYDEISEVVAEMNCVYD